MINWISIDDVIYHWDGNDTISCETKNGFSSLVPGNSLDGLDVFDPNGVIAGELFVDFSAETLSYRVIDNVYVDQIVTYGLNEEIHSLPVNELITLTGFSDLINVESDDQDLWFDIAHESQVSVYATSVLDVDLLLLSPSQSLEPLFPPIERDSSDSLASITNSHVLYDGAVGRDNLVDPLDMLLTNNAPYLG
jgi:hypothetical protein